MEGSVLFIRTGKDERPPFRALARAKPKHEPSGTNSVSSCLYACFPNAVAGRLGRESVGELAD